MDFSWNWPKEAFVCFQWIFSANEWSLIAMPGLSGEQWTSIIAASLSLLFALNNRIHWISFQLLPLIFNYDSELSGFLFTIVLAPSGQQTAWKRLGGLNMTRHQSSLKHFLEIHHKSLFIRLASVRDSPTWILNDGFNGAMECAWVHFDRYIKQYMRWGPLRLM